MILWQARKIRLSEWDRARADATAILRQTRGKSSLQKRQFLVLIANERSNMIRDVNIYLQITITLVKLQAVYGTEKV